MNSESVMPFERWVTWLFQRPVTERPFVSPDDMYFPTPATAVEYLTRLFENSVPILQPFSDAQVKQGFWVLASSGDEYAPTLRDSSVPWPDRRRAIRSIRNLHADFFAKRCSPHLSHLDEPGANPLNSICYMWWDVFPTGPVDDPPQSVFDSELISVMERTLELDSDACREGALHGLGHWQPADPDRVRRIIRRFLNSHPTVRPVLRYAALASTGYVL